MAQELSERRRRHQNFTDEEIFAIVRGVSLRKGIVLRKIESGQTKRSKQKAWDVITAGVNSVGPVVRTATEVRKKYVDFRSVVKKKMSAIDNKVKETGKSTVVR